MTGSDRMTLDAQVLECAITVLDDEPHGEKLAEIEEFLREELDALAHRARSRYGQGEFHVAINESS